jgi:hypothetical protein
MGNHMLKNGNKRMELQGGLRRILERRLAVLMERHHVRDNPAEHQGVGDPLGTRDNHHQPETSVCGVLNGADNGAGSIQNPDSD